MTKYSPKELVEINAMGVACIEKKKFTEAMRIFKELLKYSDEPIITNNLSFCLFKQNKYEEALEALKPNLTDNVMNPEAKALASSIYLYIGEREKADDWLDAAIKQFDIGVKDPKAWGVDPINLYLSTNTIKKIAGEFGYHRLILDLHKKWSDYYQIHVDIYQVGAAYFNLGYPDRARKSWAKIDSYEWKGRDAFVLVAGLVAAGLIPTFILPYSFENTIDVERICNDSLEESLKNGYNRVLVLAKIYNPKLAEDVRRDYLKMLLSINEPWLVDFAEAALRDNDLPHVIKLDIIPFLLEKGLVVPEDYLSLLSESQEIEMDIDEYVQDDEEIDEDDDISGLIELIDSGLLPKNIGSQLRKKGFYKSLSENIEDSIDLYAFLGRKNELRELKEILGKNINSIEGLDGIYLDLAYINMYLDEDEEAMRYFNKISLSRLAPEQRERYEDFLELFNE